MTSFGCSFLSLYLTQTSCTFSPILHTYPFGGPCGSYVVFLYRVKVATSMPDLPILLLIPRITHEGYSILGMGDIVTWPFASRQSS